MDLSMRGGGLHVLLENHYVTIISQIFVLALTAFFLAKSKPILMGVLYRPPDKRGFTEYLDNSLRENSISNILECYLIGYSTVILLSGDKIAVGKTLQHYDSNSLPPLLVKNMNLYFSQYLYWIIVEPVRSTKCTKILFAKILKNSTKWYGMVLLKWNYLIMS